MKTAIILSLLSFFASYSHKRTKHDKGTGNGQSYPSAFGIRYRHFATGRGW